MKPHPRYRAWMLIVSVGLLILSIVLTPHISQAGRPPTPAEAVRRAWRLAQSSGVYRFATEIVQTTHPAPSLVNVGRSSRVERLHIEGRTDVPQRTFDMTLWKDGGSLLNPRDGVEVRIEGDRAQGRAVGGTWQTIDDFSGAFAPANDLLAYLVGATNIQQAESDSANAHFVFDVDGPAFATYIRDQMENHLRETGELPAGLSLSTSDTYRAMTGVGEVWLDARGLPLRLTIHLDYPQQRNGERIAADIQTDFADFALPVADAGSPDAPIPYSDLRWFVTSAIQDLKSILPQLFLGTGFLGLLSLLLMYRRSRLVNAIFTCLMLTSMIVGPLLQSQRVAAFYTRVADQNAEAEQRQQAEDDSADSLTPVWDPHRNPLEVSESANDESRTMNHESRITNYELRIPNPQSPIPNFQSENPPDPAGDADGDGLLYVHEERLGTSADEADSDGDQIRDDVEVAGFVWPAGSGTRWYTDPNNPDTNGDGIVDTDECWSTYPPTGASPFTTPCDRDTDGDNVPDLFDTDNDNDGVPDRIDLSPFRAMRSPASPFDYDAPFELAVDGLQAGEPVFVDFQLRPTEATHLTYALNVLDWPSGDQDGQVQRHTATADSTFESVAAAQDADSSPQDGNGDIRLVPMLEITIPYDGGYGNLPVKSGAPSTRRKNAALDTWLDSTKLAPYGISVRKKDNNGTLAVYTPLNVVNDETGGGRAAFSGRMLYWPRTTTWGDPQQVRVVWLVLMLTDRCTSVPIGTSEEDAATWCDDVANWALDQQQPVHTYAEDWYLTGLAVREDHGLDVAVILEDPDDDADTRFDDNLWLLANGLETAFVSGRDADDNAKRDVAITAALGDTTLTSRFDADDLAAGTTITDRWGIPLTATLHVETFSYVHQDYIAHIMMTETVNILNEHFTTATGTPKADAPTLLFAREEHYRAVNFGDADAAAINNRRLTVTADQTHAQEVTLASVSWAPFRYQDGEWVSYPFPEYWDLIEVRFKELFPPDNSNDPNSIAAALGQVTLAKAYYLSIFNGISGLVWIGENRVWQFTEGVSDLALMREAWQTSKSLGKGIAKIVTKIVAEAVEVIPFFASMGIATRITTYLTYIGLRVQGGLQSLEGMFRSLITKLSGLSKVKIGLAAAGAVIAVAALAAFTFAPGGTAIDIIKRVVSIVGVAIAIKNVVEHGKIFVENMVRLAMGLKMVKSITDAQMKAGAIGLIVAAVVTFAAFIVSWIVSGVSFWSVAFNTMLAGAIATVVVAAIMFAITVIPVVGQIIAAIIALIDSVIFALCSAFGWDEGKVGQWVCKGISGLAAEGIRRIIYGNHVMIDMEADDRLDVQNFQQNVFDPAKGIAVGNALAINATVTTTIGLDAVPENWMAYAYYYQYSQGTLKSTTFEYELQATNEDIHETLSRKQIADWTDTPATDDKKVYIVRDIATGSSEVSLTDAGAGINRPVGLYLSEGQAIPSQECWAVPIAPLWGMPPIPGVTLAPVCYIRTEKTTNHIDLGAYFRYDIFPETLADFYAPVEKDGGYSLAWGQDTSITSTALSGGALVFPRQVDFDGDGLRSPADGGSDPDDRLWDLDGDGLSDYFESEIGSDPTLFDTDGDGLGDAEEARRETDPNRRDTDSDGLTDWEEITGWDFVYAFDDDGYPLSTWVTSDPASPDGDGDSLTDFQEKAFGFNPRAYSDPTILTFESQVVESGAPHMLLRFEERDGATAFADSSGYNNVATCDSLDEQCPAAGFAGRHGNAPRFDGSNDLVTIPDTVPAGQPGSLDLTRFSLGAWVRPTQIKTSYQPLITKQDDSGTQQNYGLFIAPNSRHLYFSLYAGNCTTSISFESTGVLTLNAWNHVMVTYDRSQARIYLNGQLDRTATLNTAPCQNDEPVRIGGAPSSSAGFSGRMDEVAIFDRALPQTEVQAVMAGRYNPQDMVVTQGDALDYEASVKNELYNRYAQGLLSTEMPGLLSGNVPPTTFVLQPQDETVMVGSVDVVSPVVASAQVDLTQVAGALITDWREQSDFAELWLRLDEEPGATSFLDYSGTMPPRSSTCSGGQCPQAGTTGAFGYALRFDGVNDRVKLPTAETLKLRQTSFTVSAWVKDSSFASGRETVLGNDTELTNRGLFLGLQGGKPAMGFYNNGLVSNAVLSTNDWHHLVFRYDKVNQEMAIFVDGELKAAETGHAAFQGSGDVYLGRSAGANYLGAWLDDVRIFERVLSTQDIRALYTQPVFKMAYEEPAGASVFVDDSGFGSYGICAGQNCPGRVGGVNGMATSYDGDAYIAVAPNAPLDMSEGKFTIATWVYPTTADSTVNNYPQGILGKYSSHISTDATGGDADAYPTLLRVGRKLRFGFGTGSAWVWRTTADDVLALNAWNHVAATFGPTYDTGGNFTGNVATLYVNGNVVGNWNLGSVVPTNATKYFYIGRSTDKARVHLDRIYVNDEGDGAGDAELYVTWDGDEIWRDDDADQSETLYIQQNLDYSTVAIIKVWEDDWVGDGEVGADDLLIDRVFTTHEVGSSSTTSLYGEGGYGPTKVTLYLSYPNSAIPFRGRIDETVIYKRPFNADEIEALYYAGASGLHLPLDDAPGSSSFENATGPNTGVCAYSQNDTANACPTTGVNGRLNQAAWFDGVNDNIEVELDVSESNYATSLWFKTEGGCAGCGLFSVDKGTRGSEGHDRHIYLNSTGNLCARVYNNETICTERQYYTDDEWHHVVHTFGSAVPADPRMLLHLDSGQASANAFTSQFYDNSDLSGTPIDTTTDSWPLDYDWSDNSNFKNVSIRWTGDFYFEAGLHTFTARADDGIRVYVDNTLIIADWTTHSARDYSYIMDMTQGLHTIKVEYFQGSGGAELEFRWSPMYRDSSPYLANATCSGSACPQSVAGKFGRALSFDGNNDWVEGANFDIPDDFTLSLWVNPDDTDDGQAFIAKHDLSFNNLIIFGFYNGGYHFRLRSANYTAGTKATGWQHLVVVGKKTGASTTEITVYKNGKLLWQHTLNTVVGNVSGRGWSLGQEWDGYTRSDFFDGKLDEVAIYNRALALDDIEKLYAAHRLYVDGQLVAAGTKASSNFTGQTGVNVGFSNDAANDYFAGRIDDVRIFHQTLANADVQALFSAAPQFQLRLDESTPTCAFRTAYYTNTLLTGDPAFERCESWPIDHDWGSGGPTDGVTALADNFSARWTGDFHFPEDGDYTFSVRTRDGVRVWLDNTLIIDRWNNTTLYSYTAARTLTAGVHNVKIEYKELAGSALIAFHWEPFFMDSVDDNHGACGSAAACPVPGVQGQVGRAAEFDGIDDIIIVGDDAALQQTTFSVGGWVKPTDLKNEYQPLVAKENDSGSERNYGLFLSPNSTQVHFSFMTGDCTSWHNGDSTGSLVLNSWNHVMMTYDGAALNLYINGYLDISIAVSGNTCQRAVDLKIGGEVLDFAPFAGRVDEVAVYDHALSPSEVREVFLYQGKWVEERQRHTLTIDVDAPTSELRSILTGARDYRANQDVMLHIAAQDATSNVALAELGVRKDGQTATTWLSAPRCDPTGAAFTGDAAWCPTFDPPGLGGEGRYTLQTRATDAVGNRETPAAIYTLYVDATPPTISTGLTGLQPAVSHPTIPNAWQLALFGTVADPALSSGDAGSGVVAGSVYVTLYTADGNPAGQGRQAAAVTGNAWALDYIFTGDAPTGAYTLIVEAADNVGNETSTQLGTLQVDATPPTVNQSTGDLPPVITATTALQGNASEQPVPLVVAWQTDDHAGESGLTLRCGTVTLHQIAAGQFPVLAEHYTWDGDVHRGSACELTLADTAGDGGIAGSVAVCGETVASWDAGYGSAYTVAFTADAPACGPALQAFGVDQVDVAFTPLLPDATLYNPAPPAGQVLHLPFEDQPDETGIPLFRDLSGLNHDGVCGTLSAEGCPATGQAGPSGSAALFDGVDDTVIVGDPADHPFFTVAAWVYRTGANAGRETVVDFGCGVVLSLNEDRWGNAGKHYPGIQAYKDAFISDHTPVPLDQWTHLVATRGTDSYLRLYRDGRQVTSQYITWASTDCDYATAIGGNRSGTGNFFPGLIDDVRIFSRGLAADEVRALYYSAGPAMALTFDRAWATANAVVADTTGRQHDGTLHTGDLLNKSVPGASGAGALAFDGIDDYVAVGPAAGLRLDHGQFTQAVWVYPTPQHTGRYPILDSGAYHVPGYRYPFIHVVNRTQLQVGFGDGPSIDTFTTGTVLTENAWNHVVATFNGTTYTVYVNGVAQAATDQFAATHPVAVQRFDVGRGAETGGTYACAQLSNLTFTPLAWSLRGYRVKVNGTVIWQGIVPTNQTKAIVKQPIAYCGSALLQVDRNYLGAWLPMGPDVTLTATPGTGDATFSGGLGKSATVAWDITAGETLYFRGQLDDVHLYPRALSDAEVRALSAGGWQATTLTSGAGTSLATWTATPPTGLEGPYRLALRGWDTAGSSGNTGSDLSRQWRGEVDTLAPRVTLTQQPNGTSYQYTAVAEDFNLTEGGFRSPCGAGFVTASAYFNDPLYLALTGQDSAGNQRLYRLTATCILDPNRREIAGAVDTPGLAYDAALYDAIVYVADGAGGLHVIDVSDPTRPQIVGSLQMPGTARAVVVAPANPTTLHAQPVLGAAKPHARYAVTPTLTAGQSLYLPVRLAASSSLFSPLRGEPEGGLPSEGLLSPTQSEDLLVESVIVTPTTLGLNQAFTTTVVVKNQSATDVIVNFWTGIFADREPVACDCCLNSWDCANILPPLSAGMTTTLVFTHSGFTRPGDHAIYAQTDAYCVLYDDPDPANNTYGPVTTTVPFVTVTAADPAGNGLSVATSDAISATFSTTIDAGTVSTRTFTVWGQQTGVYTQSYAVAGNTVTFDAQPDYKPGEDVVVSLNSDLRGADGSWLIPHAWQFHAGVNGGTGVFTETGGALGSDWPFYELELADVDGNGDLDALVDVDPIEIWLNDGTGTFTDSGNTIDSTDLQAIALGDLDGDGDLDAVLGKSGFPGTPNQIWLNQGGAQGGTPGVFVDSGQSLGLEDTWGVALGDLDGDGDLDFFAANANGDRVWFNQGGATGIFTASSQTLGSVSYAAVMGDLDNDGDIDAIGDRVWLNDGTGVLSNSGQSLSGSIVKSIALSDLDADGDLDMVFGDQLGDYRVWLNQGGTQGGVTGVFSDTGQLITAADAFIAFGDVDWDGDPDVLISDQIWLNDGSGTLTYGRSLAPVYADVGALGDIDGDGDIDAVLGTADYGPVIAINNPHAPSAVDDSFAVMPDSTANILNVLANDSDGDGDPFALTAVSMPDQGGTAVLSGTTHISYTPASGYFGVETFTYTIRDAGNAAATATVTVTVGGVNDPPNAQDDTATTNEDTAVLVSVLANDSDPNGQTVLLVSVGAPSYGTTAIVGQAVRYTPAQDVNGSDIFTYVASDGWLTGTGTVTVTITPVNDAPSFTKGADQTVAEDSGQHVVANWATDILPGPATATDEAGQVLTFTLTSADGALFSQSPTVDTAGTLRFTPAADAFGSTVVTATLQDSGGTANGGVDSSAQTFAITITNVNDAPVAVDTAITTPEDVVVTLTAAQLATDVDGDALTVVAVGAPASGAASIIGGALVYTPALNLSYTEAFTFTVADPSNARDTAMLTVTVTPLNDAPTLDAIADSVVNEDAPAQVVALSGITSGAPDEMQTLTVTASSQNMALIPHLAVIYASPDATGSLTFTPAANRYGSARIDVTVSDGLSQTTRSFTVTVTSVNDSPTLDPLADLELYPDAGPQTVNLSGIGAGPYESQVLTVTASSTNTALIPNPAVTYASPNATGSLTFTPVAGQSGTATVAVTVTDGLSATVRTFRVTVYAPPSLFAYVAADEAGLLIVDVSVPTKPRLASTYDTPGFARSVALSGTLAYIADWHRGLRIADVSDPTAPQHAGGYDTQGYATDVAVFGHYAYVADMEYGLQILDVAYPAAPQVVGHYQPSGIYIMGVTVAASNPPGHVYAYVTTSVQGLRIVDVTDPANPQWVGSASTGWSWDVEVHDGYAYVTGGSNGLRLVDVSDPANPQIVARADTPGMARGFDVAGSYAYVADESTGLQVIDLNPPPAPQATACDRYGQCTTVTATQVQATDAPARITQADGPAVDFLGAPIVLDSTAPTSVTVSTASPASLRALTVTLDAAPFHAETWASATVTEAVRTLDWTPSTEGAHVFSATVADWSGGVASTTITITVDTSPPTLGITPTVLTGTHFHAPRTLDLTGWVSDTGGAASVTGLFGDVAYVAGIEGGTWRAPVYLGQGALPDGTPIAVTARAVDVAGHATLITETVVVDLMPPSPVTLTLSSDGSPLAPGATIRAVSPTLTLAWTPASDGSGLAHYSVDWTAVTALTTTHNVTQITPAASRLAEHVAGEAQQLTVQLTSQDVHGNAQAQAFGPVYVDSPLTPDYVNLSGLYRGWMDSGCSLVGVDRRVSRGAAGQTALSAEQQFHVTWNEEALRLAWTGANWDAPATGAAQDGSDLFIYMDMRAGGAITAVNPYAGDGPVIYLPGATPSLQSGAMGADYLVWVWDAGTAVLLEWTGSEWDLAATLTPAEYRFDATTGGGLIDLYLPFALIGIADPVSATLDIVAFASGQATLDLWAVMPADNPANSDLLVETTDAPTTQTFALNHSYHWDSLGAGICPNGSDGSAPIPTIDADVQVHAAVDPAGTVYSYLDDGLFWLWELLLGDRLADITSQFATGHLRVGDGQTLTYTLEFSNEGTVTATNVFADVAAHFALRLPVGDAPNLTHQLVLLGDLAPGEARSVTFQGRVDVDYCENTLLLGDDCGWAAADILIHDSAHPSGTPLERVWVDHQVDADGPRFFGIQDPAYLIPAGENDLHGYAYDAAGVPEIAVEVQGGSTLVCPDATPGDGQWSCAWDTSGYGDGDLINVRMQVSDGLGQASAWSDWQPFRVDARPPSVTLDVTATVVVSGSLVSDSAFALVGDVADDGGIAAVQVCVDSTCGQAALLGTDAAVPATVSLDDAPPTLVAIGAATACGGSEIVRTFAVAESFTIGDVRFGFNADHAHRDDVHVTLQSPAGTTVVVLDDDGLSGTAFRHYDVLLNDAAVTALDDARRDDDPAAPTFDRTARPASPLRAFLGEDAAGTWTLRICDLNPGTDDGAYQRSRLILSPRFAAAQTGRWSYQTPSIAGLDYVSSTVTIAGTDTVGNTGDLLRLAVTVDNVAPAVTVSMVTTTITPTFATRVISGTVSDGSGSSAVFVSVKTPAGKVYQEAALRDGSVWAYDLGVVFPGRYSLWVSASDGAGNITTKGPYDVTVASWLSEKSYLPIIMQNW